MLTGGVGARPEKTGSVSSYHCIVGRVGLDSDGCSTDLKGGLIVMHKLHTQAKRMLVALYTLLYTDKKHCHLLQSEKTTGS